ncbi:DUF748 domain-containing protein [Eudoraea adriatica]|uniref:DUF748 domain-containing protein n=1 Tax=Eudoraea adriatica TaxID=446681 RepID=UPI0003732901|nr:DUF748 domain-containing protein [Eudoraea adriatica]
MGKKKILLWIGIGLGSLIVLVLLLAPPLGKRYVIKHSKELLGRKIDLEKLRLNYFTGTLKLYNFQMYEANDKDVFASFDTLVVDMEPYGYFSDHFVMEQFYLKGLNVNITKKDSIFNFDDLVAFHMASDSIPEDTLNEEPIKYSLSNLELKESYFTFDDKDVDNLTHIDDFSFFIPFVEWDQSVKSNADFKFKFKRGGYFESILNINPIEGEFDARIIVKDLYLDPFYKYVAEYALINSFDGRVNSTLDITGNINEPEKALLSGTADILDFSMSDQNGEKFMAAEKVHTSLAEINYDKESYIIDTLDITSSYVKFELDSVSNNIFRIFKLDSVREEATTETEEENTVVVEEDSSASTMHYQVNHLSLNTSEMDYTDNLTGQPFNYSLSEIEIEADSISSTADWIDIYAKMLLNDRGTLDAKLGYDPSNLLTMGVDITVERFLLSDLNIYSNHYTGHSILQGDMFYYSNSKITNGNIVSENRLLVKNVTVDNNDSGLYSLPLKFAIFLLKDKNGDINLEVPVRGDLNDPEVDIGKIVWTTFKNMITNAVAKPVNFLAGLVGGDPKELEAIEYTYLDSIPTEKQIRQFDLLLKLEEKKEGLEIDMVYYVDPDLQKEALAEAKIGALYFEKTQKDYLKDEEGFKSFVQAQIDGDSLDLNQAIMQLANPIEMDSLSNRFNRARMNSATEYLKTANDSTQIIIRTADSKEPLNKGSMPVFQLEYSMLDENGAMANDSINKP